MFRLFRRQRQNEPPSPSTEQDALNKTVTEIAIELIEGRGGKAYLSGMKRIFRQTPSLIQDVDPKYREKLLKVIEGDN